MDSEDLDESLDDDDSNDYELKSLSLDTDEFVVLIHLKSLIGMGADSAGGVGSR